MPDHTPSKGELQTQRWFTDEQLERYIDGIIGKASAMMAEHQPITDAQLEAWQAHYKLLGAGDAYLIVRLIAELRGLRTENARRGEALQEADLCFTAIMDERGMTIEQLGTLRRIRSAIAPAAAKESGKVEPAPGVEAFDDRGRFISGSGYGGERC